MGLTWKPHPLLVPPTVEEMARMEPEKLVELHDLYHEAIANAERDPYRYGFRLPHWDSADKLFGEHNELLVSGGNRSGKTQYGARLVVRVAMENVGATIFCFSQSAEISVRQQQSAVYDALPVELKTKVLGAETNISYTRKNGFSKNSLILPNGSSIIFKTYAQYQNNTSIVEGAELGAWNAKVLNVGVWLDEYLIGPELIDTLRKRLVDRNAKMLITFTPIDGYTEVVRGYLENAKTITTRTEGLIGGLTSVPIIQKSKNHNAGIIYFHSDWNPFGGWKRLSADMATRAKEEILCRFYGVPTKSTATLFPLFSREVSVVPHEKIPTKDVTRYMVLDPAGNKNWFMCWIAVDSSETYWVYREWPDVNVGDWAEWRNGDWGTGEGAKGLGYGIKDYVDLIGRLEEGETIMERLIDPRLGAAKYQGEFGSSCIIQDLDKAGLVFIPAPGLDIQDGIQAIQTKMSYIKGKPIDGLNRPHFYVSDRCQNITQALSEYTAKGGPDEAWKDPVDVVRYAAIANIRYISPDHLKTTGHRGGY